MVVINSLIWYIFLVLYTIIYLPHGGEELQYRVECVVGGEGGQGPAHQRLQHRQQEHFLPEDFVAKTKLDHSKHITIYYTWTNNNTKHFENTLKM